MKMITNTIRLLKNLAQFLNNLSRHEKFYWATNSCTKINCKIDSTVILYGNYFMRNVTIDYSSYVSHNAHVTNTSIGKFCSIGPNVVIGWGIHPIDGISTHPAFYSNTKRSKVTFCQVELVEERQPISIGNDVFIGANVTILDGVTIGDGAVIGAGAVVSKDIPPYAVAVGCPIKIVKYRFSPHVIESLLNCEWWNNDNLIKNKISKNFYNIEQFLHEASN